MSLYLDSVAKNFHQSRNRLWCSCRVNTIDFLHVAGHSFDELSIFGNGIIVASHQVNRKSPIGKSNGSKRFKLSTEPAAESRMEVYTSDSSDSDSREQKTLDYGRLGLTAECLDDNLTHLHKINKISEIETIFLNHNGLAALPVTPLCKFMNLRVLDLSSNGLTKLPQELLLNCNLSTLIVKNNLLDDDSLPKLLQSKNGNLRELNLSGNQFTQFPENVLNVTSLKYLYLSGNKIKSIPKDIWKLQRLAIHHYHTELEIWIQKLSQSWPNRSLFTNPVHFKAAVDSFFHSNNQLCLLASDAPSSRWRRSNSNLFSIFFISQLARIICWRKFTDRSPWKCWKPKPITSSYTMW